MKQHSALNRGVMYYWLCFCEERGEPFPSDLQIAQRFGFESPEMSRTLLADLSDRGKITIRHSAAGRSITIGRSSPHVVNAAKPGRIVRKPDRDVDRTVGKIMDIMRGRRAEPAKVPSPPAVRPLAPPPTPKPAPKPAIPNPPQRERAVPKAYRVTTKQINFRATEEVVLALYQRRLPGEPASAVARRIIEEHLNAAAPCAPETVPLDRKPRVRATIAAAAIERGLELHAFVGELLDLGFEAWQARERC